MLEKKVDRGKIMAGLKRSCQLSINDKSKLISYNRKLETVSPNEKTVYVSCLVDLLNEKYPNVILLDLSWNGLKLENILALEKLKFVTNIDLEYNDIDGAREEDVKFLSSLQEKICNVSFYDSSAINSQGYNS